MIDATDPLALLGTGRAVLLTDFDGVLSPIVDDPHAARPLEGAVDELVRLAGELEHVAVISGRPVSFLEQFVTDPSIDLWGLYGLEWRVGGAHGVEADATEWTEVVDALAARAHVLFGAGVAVERKGPALTVHYRNAPDAEYDVTRWARSAADEVGFAATTAKMAIEVHPRATVDKGTVVTGIVEQRSPDAAAYLGDDVGDLPAFDALATYAKTGSRVARIAVVGAEAPPSVVAAADVAIDGPSAALSALRDLRRTS